MDLAIDNYVNLLRIKADEKAENGELDRQLETSKVKLHAFGMSAYDIHELERIFFGRQNSDGGGPA